MFVGGCLLVAEQCLLCRHTGHHERALRTPICLSLDPPSTTATTHNNKIIPALERVLSLVGADVRAWFAAMPKPSRLLPQKRPLHAVALPPALLGHSGRAGGGSGTGAGGGGAGDAGPACALRGAVVPLAHGGGGGGASGGAASGSGSGMAPVAPAAAAVATHTIDSFYLSQHCAACDALTRAGEPLCARCRSAPQASAALLLARAARLEARNADLVRLCLHCGGGGGTGARGMSVGTGGGGAGGAGGAGGSSVAALLAEIGDGGIACDSLDCGVFFERRKVRQEAAVTAALAAGGLAMVAPAAPVVVEEEGGGGDGGGAGAQAAAMQTDAS